MSEATPLNVGYFDDAAQTAPTFDPGLDVPCPVCRKPLNTAPLRTISLCYQSLEFRDRSYFYRLHSRCADQLTLKEEQHLDSIALGELR